MSIISKNPATLEILNTYEELTDLELKDKLDLSQEAYLKWKNVSLEERKNLFLKLADVFKNDAEKLGMIVSKEMGKLKNEAIGEVKKCALVCEYYAENTHNILKKEIIQTEASESYVQFDPLGIILAVMPWNYPFWQVLRFAAPSIMAGNVGVLKHASNVPQCALAIEECFKQAGFPEGVFQSLMIKSSKVESVIKDFRVRGVALTGSEYAGQQVASSAGIALINSVMELGGSDPFIVLKDADIKKAVEVGTISRLLNCGQTCISAKRFILEESIADAFLDGFKKLFESRVLGDPLSEETSLAPLCSESIWNEVEEKVNKSVEMGANVFTGGSKVDSQGYFFEPTILTNLKKGMPAYDEEIFGPVASVFIVKDAEEAIQFANDSIYGLGASLWTQDTEMAKIYASQIEAGSVFINSLVKSDPRLPFGGIKNSGYGRELGSYGIKEFVNIKTIWVE